MQDINSIEGVCIFGGGDRRLRPQQQQAVKCPRCDSLNTKFCYYNNYNLSQPRHFCKSCRRYWTKGGILRNVPVGGGCRKAKRTKNKASSETTASAMSHPEQQQRKTNSHSSSDSSSLTATNSNTVLTNNYSNNSYAGGVGTAEAVTSHANLINNISEPGPEPKFYGNANNLGLEAGPGSGSDQCGIISEVGSFTSLIAPSNNETFSFGFNHKVLNGEGQQQQQCMGMGMGMGESGREITGAGGLLEVSNMHSSSDNGFGALDWQAGNGDQGLFDLPNHVDKTYWTQTQWTHQDEDHPTLYLP